MVVAAFHNYLSVRRSAAPLTLETYSRQIRKFEKSIAGKALTEVERQDVIEFLQRQRAAGLKERSLALSVSVLRHFYRFMVSGEYVQRSPLNDIPSPPQFKPFPKTFDKAEIDQILREKSDTERIGLALLIRDRAIIAVLSAGLRLSEVLALNLNDVLDALGFIHVRGKEHRDRFCRLETDGLSALNEYVSSAREVLANGNKTDVLFVRYGGHRLTRQRLWQMVTGASSATGKRMTPAILRHSRAAHMAKNGADAETIQKALGYSDIKYGRMFAPASVPKIREEIRTPTRPARAERTALVTFSQPEQVSVPAAESQPITATAHEQFHRFHPRARKRTT